MKFTFGVITGGEVNNNVIESIINQNIPEYEIIVVGGSKDWYYDKVVNYLVNKIPINGIFFNEEASKPRWIKKKKNLITRNAKYDNIVYMHDYVCLENGWYEGYKKFGDDWDISMNIINNSDGSRYRDWCIWDDPEINYRNNGEHSVILPPYNYGVTEHMYISGAYWVAKKYVMEKEPLNEDLLWAQGEDVEWSKRVIPKYNYKMNEYSKVKLLKDKKLSAEML